MAFGCVPQQGALLLFIVLLSSSFFVKSAVCQTIHLKVHRHDAASPKVLPNSLKLSPALIASLSLNVPADFEKTVLQDRYTFTNRNLLAKALLHGSYMSKERGQTLESYEPLDQVGTMVLDYIISRPLIMNSQTNFYGNQLTTMRAALVNQRYLTFVALKNGLDKYLFIDQDRLKLSHIVAFREAIKDIDSYQQLVERIPDASKRPRPGDFMHRMFKALVGAIYVDSGYDLQKTDDVIMPMFKRELDIVFNRALRKQKVL